VSTFFGAFLVAIEVVKRFERQWELANKPLPQVTAKRCCVGNRQADVFIKVKRRDAISVGVLFLNKLGEHFKL
jgi:hypothetical protein